MIDTEHGPAAAEPVATPSRWAAIPGIDVAIAVSVGMLVLIGQAAVATSWASLGVFRQWDVIFDSDPITWSTRLVQGWSIGDMNHPLLVYFFSVPLRAVSSGLGWLGVVDDPVAFRADVGVYIPPLATALKAVCLYATFRLLELSRIQATLATAFGVVAFSSTVFGAVPESYAVTGLAISMVTLSSVLLYVRRTHASAAVLLVPDLFAVGTTISNVAHVGWMRCGSLWARGWRPMRAFVVAVAYGALLLVAAVAAFYGLATLRGQQESATRRVLHERQFVQDFTGTPREQLGNLLRFPETLGRTFIPTMPRQRVNVLAITNDQPIRFEFTYRTARAGLPALLLGVGMLAALGGGTLMAYRRGGTWRWVGLASVASLVTFALLYSVFGVNRFLYSQHWQVQALVLLAAWLHWPPLRSRVAYALLTVALFLILVGDWYVLQVMTDGIRAVL